MNTETKAGHDATNTVEAAGTRRESPHCDTSKDQLLADMETLAADMEKLVKASTATSTERFTAVRALRHTAGGGTCETRADAGSSQEQMK